MKKVIEGKRYSTQSAKILGSWHFETLYQKRTGEFFLYRVKNSEENITPVSYTDAESWSRKHLPKDVYNSAFGKVADTRKKTIALSLPAGIVEKLRLEAGKSGSSMSDIVASLIEML